MIPAIRSEWIKLRTARANLVLGGLAVLIPLLICLPIAVFGNFDGSDIDDIFTAAVLAPTYLCVFLSGVIGVLGIGQEYRHNTIRVTFTNDSSRTRVLGAKVIVTTLFGLGMGLVAQLLCFGLAKAIFLARDIDFGFGEGDGRAGFIGQIVLCGLFTLAGFGFGAILRQPAGAIPVLLLWPLILENVVFSLLLFAVGAEGMLKWLPFNAGLSLPVTSDSGDSLSRLTAGLYFGGFVAILCGIGWVLVNKRDA